MQDAIDSIPPDPSIHDVELHTIPTISMDFSRLGHTERSICLSKTGSCSSRNLAKFIIAERIFLTRPASGLIKSRMEKSVIPTNVINSTLPLDQPRMESEQLFMKRHESH